MAAASGDEGGWVSAVGLITPIVTFVAGLLGAVFLKGMSWANADGRSKGDVAAWRAAIEARLSAIEARKEKIDSKLDDVPTREEMDKRFDRLERRLEIIDSHTQRAYPPPAAYP